MNKTKIVLSTCIFLLMGMSMVNAQNRKSQKVDSITNKELEKAAATLQEAKKIQQSANQKLRQVVKESDIDFQRYQEIMMSKKRPKQGDSLNVTDKEKKVIKEIKPKLAKINQQSKQQFNKVITDQGLTPKRFQQIMLVLRQKPKVAQRFQKIMAKQKKQ